MTTFRSCAAASAILAGSLGQAAWADISAEQAWTSIQDIMRSSGYEVRATENPTGNGLEVTDVTFEVIVPDQSGAAQVKIDRLDFVENADGSVSVDMPDVIPFAMTFEVEPGQQGTMSYKVTQDGADLVLSGSPEEITQTYKAASVSVAVDQFDVPGEEMTSDMMEMTFSMKDVTSSTFLGAGAPRPMSFTAAAGQMVYDMSVSIPGEGGFAFQGDLQDLAFEGAGSLPETVEAADFQTLLKAGYALKGVATHGSGSTLISGEDQEMQFAAKSAAVGGQLTFDIDGQSLAYGLTQSDAAVSITSSQMPFPVDLETREFGFSLNVPVMANAEPQDFGMRVNLSDFSMSDLLWSVIDAGSVLPRDPATLLVDLSGKTTLLVDFMDPNALEQIEANGAPPAQLNTLDVKNLQVKLAGAELTGMGGFTFDNSDLQAFGGMPRPAGAVDLALSGGNGLLNKLEQMGLVDPGSANGARMMMGLLAVPGDGPDTLKSKLEITPEGQIFANGQRIQ